MISLTSRQDLHILDGVDYATLLQYSPRGITDTSKTSRTLKDTIKGGRISKYKERIFTVLSDNKHLLDPFINRDTTLVPIPRSSLIKAGDLWPSLEIAKMLASFDWGTVAPCLIRHIPIRKSSLYYKADDRPAIIEQFDSMRVDNYVPTANITLIDDVLTLGRTSLAGASRVAEKFPNATIRVFGLIQTQGLIPEISDILNVETGRIVYHPASGKCSRLKH